MVIEGCNGIAFLHVKLVSFLGSATTRLAVYLIDPELPARDCERDA